MSTVLEIVDGFRSVDATDWDQLVGDMPLLRHAFLVAFEDSKSVGDDTGWQATPLLLKEADKLVGGVPLYLKQHSYGEYVFDWSWANAYEQHGLPYYPKLLAAIPFTPITSARLVANTQQHRQLLLSGLTQLMHDQQFSSVHINFPDSDSEAALAESGWLRREGVQFRWENQSFEDFDTFLSTLSRSKRKKIRQERKKVANSGVTYKTVLGSEISEADWQFFYRCYTQTYLEHHSTPYLNLAFFQQIGQTMPENIVLFLAYQDQHPIAAALNIYHQQALYGRYWGATTYVPNLHFELCYYQAQVFCIESSIRFFEGGAQGEHKLARGFTARPTCSFHLIARPEFKEAIQAVVQREKVGINAYVDELELRSPYKKAVVNTSSD